ncbi:MAG: class I SAM-dependent methyltransferase [Gemmatimonadetes bacterium]|nr:class I SAM-dependent methyltransferase [Gemmatimonadota bacterium]
MNLRVLPSGPCEIDFAWYDTLRTGLLRREAGSDVELLDVGCGRGDILLMLATQIRRGVGIDVDRAALSEAERRRTEQGIKGVTFQEGSVLNLDFADSQFDVVLLLGDVLTYPDLYGKHDRVLMEMKRVLRSGGKVVHQSMNWDWEYRSYAPTLSCFKRDKGSTWIQEGEGKLTFHRTRRTVAGLETTRDYEVVPDSPLEEWVQEQDWPVSPQEWNTSLDVEETGLLPRAWLKSTGVSRYKHYRPRDLQSLYRRAGFEKPEVIAYGQTYDIAEKAELLQEMIPFQDRLAEAEVELACGLRLGSGPWLLLVAGKV